MRLKDFSSLSISSLNFLRTLTSSLEYSSSVAGYSVSRTSTSPIISVTILFMSITKNKFKLFKMAYLLLGEQLITSCLS